MNPKKRELSVDMRTLIVKLYAEGNSMQKVANIVKKPKSTVQYTIEHYGNTGTVKNIPRSGRPKILNDRHERHILREIKKTPKNSATKIAKDLENELNVKCSAETVRNVLRRHNYHARSCRKKPFISARNKSKRLQYATEHVKKNQAFWNNVIFSDESKYNIHGSDGRQKVWRKPNTELNIENVNATVKHGGGSVMVWGCMSAAGIGKLSFIETTMDSKGYLNILQQNLLESARQLGIRNDFIFMHDNDPKHTSRIVREWLLYNVKTTLNHPPQSPDLNPIEHLWEELERRIRKHKINSKRDLQEKLEEEWNKIEPSVTEKLVKSMERRLRAVIKSRENPTKY